MLKLLEKWPDQISQLGPQMAENLLLEEKKTQGQLSPENQSCLNDCRRILIGEVLPIITNRHGVYFLFFFSLSDLNFNLNSY